MFCPVNGPACGQPCRGTRSYVLKNIAVIDELAVVTSCWQHRMAAFWLDPILALMVWLLPIYVKLLYSFYYLVQGHLELNWNAVNSGWR